MPVNGIIHLSDASLIAIHALVGLADAEGRLVQGRDLAAIIDASENHLAKVMQRLVRAGIVRSVKGPNGGFALDRRPEDISFKEAIEAVDGPISSEFCPFRTDRCTPGNCIFGKDISRHAIELVAYLSRRTVADIARERAPDQPPEYRVATVPIPKRGT